MLDSLNPNKCGFYAFREGFPSYNKSIFKNKVEIVTNGKGRIIGVTNADKLFFANIPDSAEGIQILEVGEGAFKECKKLRHISFSDNLEYIADSAFASLPFLERVDCGKGLYEMGEGVFASSSISSFSFPPLIRDVPSRCFSDCSKLVGVTFTSPLNTLGILSFSGTKSLRSIELGQRIKEIPDGAFLSSGITSITIPHSCLYIGASAFSSCKNLLSIYYDGSEGDFKRIHFGPNWNRGLNKDCALFLKDRNGCWYNAFNRERKNEDNEEKEIEIEKYLKVLDLDSLPSTGEELTQAYHKKALIFHPDRISSLNLDKEYIEFASSRFREITDAYTKIKELIK